MLSNSMGWYWKISFIICVFWTVLSFLSVSFRYGGFMFEFDLKEFLIMSLPITIWITVRWISLNPENKN